MLSLVVSLVVDVYSTRSWVWGPWWWFLASHIVSLALVPFLLIKIYHSFMESLSDYKPLCFPCLLYLPSPTLTVKLILTSINNHFLSWVQMILFSLPLESSQHRNYFKISSFKILLFYSYILCHIFSYVKVIQISY